jgi:hypothetical protein
VVQSICEILYGVMLLNGAMKKSSNQKKCCYMNRDCTLECVAYSTANELNESAKIMGMNSMNCVRLLLDLTEFMNMMRSEDYENEEDEDFEDEDAF